ncbi:MAG: DUF362 domain-containing protein [Pseudomonadota bacterium]
MNDSKAKVKIFFISWQQRARLPELIERASAVNSILKNDFVAVKMHFGERGNDGYIQPEYVRPILKMIRKAKAKPFLTDTNTIYTGPRNNAVGHLTVAAEHGFTHSKLQTPIIISDGLRGDEFELVEVNGDHFQNVKIANGIAQSDFLMVLSHFKGHLLSGFGGALKNLGMGCGARVGKFEMHSSVAPTFNAKLCIRCGACIDACAQKAISLTDDGIVLDVTKCAGCGECVISCDHGALSITWNEGAAGVQERYVEYAAGAVKGKRAFYLNFVNHVTANCDCMGIKEKPLVPDIGILASSDPVAIDQASLDLVTKAGGDIFEKAHSGVDCTVQLVHAEKMGIGCREYELIEI